MRKPVALLATMSLLVAAAPAEAGHARYCGSVAKGKQRVFASKGVSCKFARRWSKRYLKKRRRPRAYSCSRPRGPVTFYCRRGGKFYYARRR